MMSLRDATRHYDRALKRERREYVRWNRTLARALGLRAFALPNTDRLNECARMRESAQQRYMAVCDRYEQEGKTSQCPF